MKTWTSDKTSNLGSALRGIVRLIRPLNCMLFIAGVLLGGLLVAGAEAFQGHQFIRLGLAAGSAMLIGGGGNSINDVFDREIDRINRPGRPLPSGQVSARTAWWTWGAASAVGLLVSIWLSATHAALAGGCFLLLYLYSAQLKRIPLAGNVLVALVVALALVYGGAAVGPVGPAALVGVAFAFLTTLVREIIKDVQDARGDAKKGLRTLPIVYGAGVTARGAAGVLALTIALTPLPFLVLDYGGLFLLLVLFADLFLLRVVWLLQEGPTASRMGQASSLMKWGMVVGMSALVAAGLAGGDGIAA